MTIEEVLAYYGNGHKFKVSTGISYGNIYYWQTRRCIPLTMQFRIEELTNGELVTRAEDSRVKGVSNE